MPEAERPHAPRGSLTVMRRRARVAVFVFFMGSLAVSAAIFFLGDGLTRGSGVRATPSTPHVPTPMAQESSSSTTGTEGVATAKSQPALVISNAKASRPRKERKTRVHGVVLDASGRPIAGARIRLIGFAGDLLGEASTDA